MFFQVLLFIYYKKKELKKIVSENTLTEWGGRTTMGRPRQTVRMPSKAVFFTGIPVHPRHARHTYASGALAPWWGACAEMAVWFNIKKNLLARFFHQLPTCFFKFPALYNLFIALN